MAPSTCTAMVGKRNAADMRARPSQHPLDLDSSSRVSKRPDALGNTAEEEKEEEKAFPSLSSPTSQAGKKGQFTDEPGHFGPQCKLAARGGNGVPVSYDGNLLP